MEITKFIKHFKGVKQKGNDYMALCPAHDDKNPSLAISIGKIGDIILHCFSGCETKDILKAAGLTMSDLFNDSNNKQTKLYRPEQIETGCSLKSYSANKKLPISFLKSLGVKEVEYNNKPQISIPYHNTEGIQTALKYRIGNNGRNKFRWRPGANLSLYGLNRLKSYNPDYICLVEGESNCHTLFFHGFQALGIPGSSNWKESRDACYLKKFKTIYALIDINKSGMPDAGGRTVLKWLSKSAIKDKTRLVLLPVKDVSELHIKNPESFSERFKACLKKAIPFNEFGIEPGVTSGSENKDKAAWDIARELFPRQDYPWHILPDEIADSLKQLARAHATSPLSLPGAAMAILASVLGGTISVSPKSNWNAPFILWFADIRPSGSGKTPAMRALCKVLYSAQAQADREHEKLVKEELAKKKKDRRPVPRAKSYFITDLTLEGLMADSSGHGGSCCILNELSAFLSGQNQYKSKGTDREAWLCLYDGDPTRIVRAGKTFTVRNARISICGGIQPRVWQDIFGSGGGFYVEDGTVLRFLATYENDIVFPYTRESWAGKNKALWEDLLTSAMEWSDCLISKDGWKPKRICLSSDAQNLFFDWGTELQEMKEQLPGQLQGYVPKLIGSSLRLAGVLHCLNKFAAGTTPGNIITVNDMQKGIDAVSFYAGHIVDASQSLTGELVNPADAPLESEQVKHLVETLALLRPEIDNGLLAIGYIQECFNKTCQNEQRIKTPHAMGALIRRCKLSIPAGHFRANKKSKSKCLLWNKKTENLINKVRKVRIVRNGINHAGLKVRTLKNQSPQSPQKVTDTNKPADFADIKKTKSATLNLRASSNADNADIADIVSKENIFLNNNEPELPADVRAKNIEVIV